LKKSTVIADLNLENEAFNLVTLHRHYNVDDHTILEHILLELGKLNERVIFPVHPRTRKNLSDNSKLPEQITLIEPQGYLDFVALENESKRIITDSGGIQKEAYILRKPCVTLRSETEWVETVHEGWNCLINPSDNDIAARILEFDPPSAQRDIFGTHVTENMVQIVDSIQAHK